MSAYSVTVYDEESHYTIGVWDDLQLALDHANELEWEDGLFVYVDSWVGKEYHTEYVRSIQTGDAWWPDDKGVIEA